jgi:hypothetical protein
MFSTRCRRFPSFAACEEEAKKIGNSPDAEAGQQEYCSSYTMTSTHSGQAGKRS